MHIHAGGKNVNANLAAIRAAHIRGVQQRIGRDRGIPVFVMGNDRNVKHIEELWRENDFYGFPENDVVFYSQNGIFRFNPSKEDILSSAKVLGELEQAHRMRVENGMLPPDAPFNREQAVDQIMARNGPVGDFFRTNDGMISTKPAGHLEMLIQPLLNGQLAFLAERGCKILVIPNGDDMGFRIEPKRLGHFLRSQKQMMASLVERPPGQTGGFLFDVDWDNDGKFRPQILEKDNVPPEFDYSSIHYLSANQNYFNVEGLFEFFFEGGSFEENLRRYYSLKQEALLEVVNNKLSSIPFNLAVKPVRVGTDFTKDGRPIPVMSAAAQVERLIGNMSQVLTTEFLIIPKSDFGPIKQDGDRENTAVMIGERIEAGVPYAFSSTSLQTGDSHPQGNTPPRSEMRNKDAEVKAARRALESQSARLALAEFIGADPQDQRMRSRPEWDTAGLMETWRMIGPEDEADGKMAVDLIAATFSPGTLAAVRGLGRIVGLGGMRGHVFEEWLMAVVVEVDQGGQRKLLLLKRTSEGKGNEAEVQRAAHDANHLVPQVYFSGQIVSDKVIVQEFRPYPAAHALIRSWDFQGRMFSPALTEADLGRVLEEAVQVSADLHDSGVVHGDGKLEHILLDRGHVSGVIDFGLGQIGVQDEMVKIGDLMRLLFVLEDEAEGAASIAWESLVDPESGDRLLKKIKQDIPESQKWLTGKDGMSEHTILYHYVVKQSGYKQLIARARHLGLDLESMGEDLVELIALADQRELLTDDESTRLGRELLRALYSQFVLPLPQGFFTYKSIARIKERVMRAYLKLRDSDAIRRSMLLTEFDSAIRWKRVSDLFYLEHVALPRKDSDGELAALNARLAKQSATFRLERDVDDLDLGPMARRTSAPAAGAKESSKEKEVPDAVSGSEGPRSEARVTTALNKTRSDALAPVTPNLRLKEPAVVVLEKERIEGMSRAELRQFLGFAAINKEKLWLVVPDMLTGKESQFLADLRALGVRVSLHLPGIARNSKVRVLGFSDKERDTADAFRGRLGQRLAKGVTEYFALENGEGLFLALLIAKPEDLAVMNGFRYDKSGRYRAELRAFLQNLNASYFVISKAA